MKFKEAKKEFLEFLKFEKGYSKKTLEAYKRDILKFEIYTTEFSINYKKINKEIIFDFHSDLSQSIGPRSFSRTLSSLRTFYRFLYYHSLFEKWQSSQ